MKQLKESKFLLYETDDGRINVDVILKDETIWLSQKSMAELFDKDIKTINRHLINIYQDDELLKDSTISFFEIVQKEGNRNVKRNIEFYNLDAIIAVGYRVNSKKATQFRIWATKVIKEYITKGFVIDKERLTNLFLDYAEDMALEEQLMTMKDWINATDDLLKLRKKNILESSGKVSHEMAVEKAESEYEIFRIKQDKEYVSSMDILYKKYLTGEENKEE